MKLMMIDDPANLAFNMYPIYPVVTEREPDKCILNILTTMILQ